MTMQMPHPVETAQASPLSMEGQAQAVTVDSAPTMSRRTFGMNALIVVAAMAFDQEQREEADQIWASGHTDITLPKTSRDALQVGVAFDGFGDFGPGSGLALAKDMQRLTTQIPWGGVTYSNEYGVSLEDDAKLLTQAHESQRFGMMDLYGRSLGGMLGLNAAMQARVPLGMVFLNCSPFSLEDTRNSAWASLGAAGVIPKIPLTGIIEKLAEDVHDDGLLATAENIVPDYEQAEVSLPRSGSPMLEETELAAADGVDLWRDRALFKRLIHKEITRAAYVMTENPDADVVVNNHHAFQEYREWFKSFGVELYPIKMPGTHADVSMANHYGASWICSATAEISRQFQPQLVADRRPRALSRRALFSSIARA